MTINYKKGDHDTRPWGTWEIIEVGNEFVIKKIIVNPKQKLSLQSHNFRSEHWIVVDGEIVVTKDSSSISVKQNEHIFISEKTKHRAENTSERPATFIEIQTGKNLDENDIIRYEDIYGRA